jgi:predicted nuclease of predicted toxin-antitoxin system
MKLLIDMNLSPSWAVFLGQSGWAALHWSSVGPADARDSEIMAYAATHDYVVLTHDLDFGSILAVTHGGKPSVVQLRTEDVGGNRGTETGGQTGRFLKFRSRAKLRAKLGRSLAYGERPVCPRIPPYSVFVFVPVFRIPRIPRIPPYSDMRTISQGFGSAFAKIAGASSRRSSQPLRRVTQCRSSE